MKAYRVFDNWEPSYATVVYAETAGKAKAAAKRTDTCEDSEWTDIRVRRFPEMDGNYRGREEMDWNDKNDRAVLVALGWSCGERNWECDTCESKAFCYEWEGEEEEP